MTIKLWDYSWLISGLWLLIWLSPCVCIKGMSYHDMVNTCTSRWFRLIPWHSGDNTKMIEKIQVSPDAALTAKLQILEC